jgi:hypothetical protein
LEVTGSILLDILRGGDSRANALADLRDVTVAVFSDLGNAVIGRLARFAVQQGADMAAGAVDAVLNPVRTAKAVWRWVRGRTDEEQAADMLANATAAASTGSDRAGQGSRVAALIAELAERRGDAWPDLAEDIPGAVPASAVPASAVPGLSGHPAGSGSRQVVGAMTIDTGRVFEAAYRQSMRPDPILAKRGELVHAAGYLVCQLAYVLLRAV